MLRRIVVASLALVLLGVLIVAAPGMTRAQNSTPSAAAAVKKTALGQFESAVAPGRTLLLQERTFPAGSDSGAHPAPGPVVLYVESGTVTFSVIDGAAMVTKSGSTAAQTLAAGNSVQLSAGDAVTYDQGVVHDVKNTGTETAVTIEARLNPTAAATPAPATATP